MTKSKYTCLADYHMNDGSKVFTEGEVYEFTEGTSSEAHAIDDEGTPHYMPASDMLEYFIKDGESKYRVEYGFQCKVEIGYGMSGLTTATHCM